MKKFSKILAVILTVCLLGGMIAVMSSAAPATIDPENQLVIPTVGAPTELVSGNYSFKDYEQSGVTHGFVGAHGLPDYTYKGNSAIFTDQSGNHYYSIRRDNSTPTGSNNGNSGYLEWSFAGWSNNASNYNRNNVINKFDYHVFDFDFKVDSYSVFVGYELVYYSNNSQYKIEEAYRTYSEVTKEAVEADIKAVFDKLCADVKKNADKLGSLDTSAYTAAPISVDEALATKDLALVPGANMYAGVRTYTTTNYDTSAAKAFQAFLHTAKFDGEWYLAGSASANPYVKINFNEYIHISVIFAKNADNAYQLHVFANGEYLFTSSAKLSADTYKVICVDSFRIQMPVLYKDTDRYSYCFDNLTSNFYASGYNTGEEVYGLDDYMASGDYKTKPLYELSDVVFNADYASPNGYISVDGVKATLTLDNMFANLANVKNGSIVETTVDILDFEIPEGVDAFTVYAPYGSVFTLSEKNSNDYFNIFDGVGTYTVRKALEEEKMTVNWIYIDPISQEQKVIKTEKLISGNTPNVNDPSFLESYFDLEEESYITNGYIDWRFDIDNDSGDVDLFDMEAVRALTYYESKLVMEEMGGILNIYTDTIGEKERLSFDFYIGSYGPDGSFILNVDETGNYANYTDISKLNTELARANDGDTLYFKEGGVFELGAFYYASIPEGKTVNVDLNGSVISRSANATSDYTDGLFRVSEGATLNLYSSKPGAHYVEAILTKPSSNRVFGTGGIISVPSTVDGCEINVNGENIAFTGGTLFKFNGGWSSLTDIVSNNTKKVLNITGGNYYSALRSSYSLICVQCPDVVINLKDASFYVNDSTYAIFHDYANDSANSKYYSSTHELNAVNCDFACVTTAGEYAKLYYTMGVSSKAYFEDCKIIGMLAKSAGDLKGSVTLGAGNEVSTSAVFASKVKTADGVQIANTDSSPFNVEISVAHADIPNRTNIVLKDGDTYYYDETTGVFDVVDGKYRLNLDKFTANNIVVSEFNTFGVTFLTYGEGDVPPGAREIKWYDSDGSLLATTYGYAGSTVTPYPIDKVSSTDTDSKWYNLGYSTWENISEGAASDSLVIVDGENAFKPATPALVADVDAFISMTYWSHYGVNLYVPSESGITFSYNNADGVTGFYFYYDGNFISAPSPETNYNLYYNGQTFSTSYITIQPDINNFDYSGSTYYVRFVVDEYDLNGDGVIGEGESDILLEQSFELNDMEYSIRAAGVLDCGSEEMHLISSYVRYKLAVHSEMNGGTPSEEAERYLARFNEALAAHGEDCSCYTDYTKVEELFTEEEKNVGANNSAIANLGEFMYTPEKKYGIVAFSFTMNLGRPAVSIYYTSDDPAYKISAVTVKYISSTTGDTESVKASMKTITNNVELNGITCTRLDCHSISAQNINDIFEFNVTIAKGSVKNKITIQYCLAEYIKNNPDYELAKMYYDYSYQCEAYYNKLKTEAGNAFDDSQNGVVIGTN